MAPAQKDPADEIVEKVARYTKIMADREPDASWTLITRLKALGPRVVEALKPYLEKGSPTVRIAAAGTLIHFGEKALGHKALLALASSPDQTLAARRITLRILGSQGDLSIAPDIKSLMDRTADPRIKLEAARALWVLSQDHRPAARSVLEAFLKSDDLDLKAEGALALAAFEAFEKARPVLEALRDEPSERGQLARSYLRTLNVNRQLQRYSVENARFVPARSRFDLLAEVLHKIDHYHPDGDKKSVEDLLGAAAKGMLRKMDTHSTYLTAKQRADWMFDLNKNYCGIGAFVNFNQRDVFTIIRPIYSGPAYRAGLRTDDNILEVDGWSTRDQDLNEIVKRLKGPAGTLVKIKVMRRVWKEPRIIAIKRARIKIQSVRWEMLPGKIGYVELTGFGGETSHELDVTLGRLNAMGMVGLILDLRDNQGGYLPTAIKVADKFLDRDKLIVYWEGRNKILASREEIRTTEALTQPDYPLVVLTNQHSASASEIVAGALQYYGRAKLVGRRTYGTGSVQQILNLNSRPGDKFFDRPRRNGWYDTGEAFTDRNRNGRYDSGEPFEDRPRKNGSWDPGETFEDQNRNGKRDEGEPFEDTNSDGEYNPPEAYEDQNGNGRFDIGPGIKITIARYYLPDGRCIHKERNRDGVVVEKGGIQPDIEVKPMEWASWKEEEVSKLLEGNVFRKYVNQHWDAHKALFDRLASYDRYDHTRYPDFAAFHKSLNTRLEAGDVRRWLRLFVRRKVMDHRGREFVGIYFGGDFQEDRQLQRAIVEVYNSLSPPRSVRSIEEYKRFEIEKE